MVKQRTPAHRFADIPGELPKAHIADDVDLSRLSHKVIDKISALKKDDLTEGVVWRDLLSLTDHLRTFHSAATVSQAWSELNKAKQPCDFKLVPGSTRVVRMGPEIAWIDVGFEFITKGKLVARNAGIVSVVPSDSITDPGWRIWMIRTWLENFQGHGHPDDLPHRASDEPNDKVFNGSYATPDQTELVDFVYDAVIVGAGQAGLGIAGRLKTLGCSYLLVERNEEIGDNWTKRYDSLRWHTSKEYGNLPFDRTFLPEDDYMLTTKVIAAGFKRWVARHEIDVSLRTSVDKATWNQAAQLWTVVISNGQGDRYVSAKNLVLACGAYAGSPKTPSWPGREKYKGTAIHGTEYTSASSWAGKKGVVVGTANTGHDVAEDMVQAGFASTTMVQRGRTFVFPVEWLSTAQNVHYNLNVTAAQADRLTMTYPCKITREMTNFHVFKGFDIFPDRFDALERAGFEVQRKGDIYDNLYCRFGGHYVDTGTSARIANGKIRIKRGSVREWTEAGLRFEDGSELEADLVVLCTGFNHDFRIAARQIVGNAADDMDEYFGLDAEGEIRGAFKYAGHPCLYYTGGDIRQCRFFGGFIALQIQAAVLGAPMQRYLETPA